MSLGPHYQVTHTTSTTVQLREAAPGRVSRWLIHIRDAGSWNGSVTPKARSPQMPSATAVAVAFYDMATGAMSTTAPTNSADALILVDSAGCEIELAVVVSAGAVEIAATPLEG